MANSTNTPAQASAQTGNLKIKCILITIGICLLCILFTYLLKPTYAANYSRLAIKTDKSLNEARLLLEIESNSKYRFISSFSTNKKSKAVVFEAAEETAKKIEKLSKKILSLRILLCEESGGIYALEKNKSKWDEMGFRKIKISRDSLLDGTPVGFKNRSASNKIFITNGELKKLKAEITKTRNALFEIMDNLVKVSENTEGVIFRYNDVEYLKANLKLEDPEKKSQSDWLNLHFSCNTVAESLLLLRKIEFDATASLFQVMSLLNDNIAY